MLFLFSNPAVGPSAHFAWRASSPWSLQAANQLDSLRHMSKVRRPLPAHACCSPGQERASSSAQAAAGRGLLPTELQGAGRVRPCSASPSQAAPSCPCKPALTLSTCPQVVADTGDISAIKEFKPVDCTTNPRRADVAVPGGRDSGDARPARQPSSPRCRAPGLSAGSWDMHDAPTPNLAASCLRCSLVLKAMQDPDYCRFLDDAVYQEKRRGNPQGIRWGPQPLPAAARAPLCLPWGGAGPCAWHPNSGLGFALQPETHKKVTAKLGARPSRHALPSPGCRRPHSLVADQLAVNIGTELLSIVPGRVSWAGYAVLLLLPATASCWRWAAEAKLRQHRAARRSLLACGIAWLREAPSSLPLLRKPFPNYRSPPRWMPTCRMTPWLGAGPGPAVCLQRQGRRVPLHLLGRAVLHFAVGEHDGSELLRAGSPRDAGAGAPALQSACSATALPALPLTLPTLPPSAPGHGGQGAAPDRPVRGSRRGPQAPLHQGAAPWVLMALGAARLSGLASSGGCFCGEARVAGCSRKQGFTRCKEPFVDVVQAHCVAAAHVWAGAASYAASAQRAPTAALPCPSPPRRSRPRGRASAPARCCNRRASTAT